MCEVANSFVNVIPVMQEFGSAPPKSCSTFSFNPCPNGCYKTTIARPALEL